MTRPTCLQLRTKLKEIKELKAEFDLELLKIKDTRDTALALGSEKEMRDKMYLLDIPRFCLMSIAEQIMTKDFLGPEAIEKTFGFKPEIKDIPSILFSKADLERAKELGQFLILRIDRTPAGQPLTMKNMKGMLSDKFQKEGHGKILYDVSWYKNEYFFKKETPKLSWSLVSKEVIPNSIKKNYLEQTEIIIDYVKDFVFKGRTMPPEYQKAISEFAKKKSEIKKLMDDDWQKVYQILTELSINKLTRQSPAECIYDLLVYFKSNKERLLENTYTWTSRGDSDSRPVDVGYFDSDGADINSDEPDDPDLALGVSFSRSR